MMVIIYLLLVLRGGCCAADPFIDAKSINVGDHVTMICSRRTAGDIYWMRIAFGNSLVYVTEKLHDSLYSHIKVKPEAGTLELRIISAKLNDSALYLCVRKYQENITHLNATYLKVEEMAVTRPPPSVPVHLKNSVTLQCSVLRYSQKTSCLYCFRTEFNQTHPNFNYDQIDEEDKDKNIFEGFTAQECFHNHLKNLSSSGVQMYHCGVSVPKQEDESEHNIEGRDMFDLKNSNPALFLLSATLAICLVVITFLTYFIQKPKNKSNGRYSATAMKKHALHGGNQETQQMDEAYCAADFSKRQVCKRRTSCSKCAEQEALYTEVMYLQL